MKTLGLIGGIGSGKSTVASLFRDLGAAVINADEIGHQVLLRHDVKEQARIRWGHSVFDSHSELDRRKLADIVFVDTPSGQCELEFLKSVTHPLIGEGIERQLKHFAQNSYSIVVLDIPLLLEAQWDKSVDNIVFVDASRSTRLERVKKRGWTESEFQSREKAQMPLDEKRSHADWVIRNNGNLVDVLDQIKKIWQNLG